MSVPEHTGRARAGRGCRWCGPRAETVKYEIRDPETGGIGSEVMCCVCGKNQWRWGWEKKFWARETHRQVIRGVLVTAWLAARIIESASPGRSVPAQLGLFDSEAADGYCTLEEALTGRGDGKAVR